MLVAIIAGILALLGVGLGGFISYVTAKATSARQAKDARRARTLTHLQRVNVLAESFQNHFQSVLLVIHRKVNDGIVESIPTNEHWSLAELEFLTRVYLSRAKIYFYEMQALEKDARDKLFEAYSSSPEQLATKSILAESIKLSNNFNDSIEHLREELVEYAQELESD